MLLFHSELLLLEYSHDLALHLFCFKLNVLASELLLLKQSQFFGFLPLAYLLGDLAIGFGGTLLAQGVHLPLKALVDFIDLLNFAPFQGLSDYFKLKLSSVVSALDHTCPVN